MRKRIKYNWLFAIKELHMEEAFKLYKIDNDEKQRMKGKKPLSIKRLARAFILHMSKDLNQSWFNNCPEWRVGHEEPLLEMSDVL